MSLHPGTASYNPAGNSDFTRKAEALALGITNWSTPKGSDGAKGGPGQSYGSGGMPPLPAQAAQWQTPVADDQMDRLRAQLRLAPAVDLATQPVHLVVGYRCLPLCCLRWQRRRPARAITLARATLRSVRRFRRRPVGDAQRQRFCFAGKVAVPGRVVAIRAGMQAHRCGPG